MREIILNHETIPDSRHRFNDRLIGYFQREPDKFQRLGLRSDVGMTENL